MLFCICYTSRVVTWWSSGFDVAYVEKAAKNDQGVNRTPRLAFVEVSQQPLSHSVIETTIFTVGLIIIMNVQERTALPRRKTAYLPGEGAVQSVPY